MVAIVRWCFLLDRLFSDQYIKPYVVFSHPFCQKSMIVAFFGSPISKHTFSMKPLAMVAGLATLVVLAFAASQCAAEPAVRCDSRGITIQPPGESPDQCYHLHAPCTRIIASSNECAEGDPYPCFELKLNDLMRSSTEEQPCFEFHKDFSG